MPDLIEPPIALQSGDHLLYGKSCWYDEIIAIKTWSPAVHIEIYAGNNKSVASRNGEGVGCYDLRLTELIAILRPLPVWNFERAMAWFETSAKGQAYDWKGLLCFTLAVKQGSPNKMFCSEFAARFDWEGGLMAFNQGWPADKIAPGDFLISPVFVWAWKSDWSA